MAAQEQRPISLLVDHQHLGIPVFFVGMEGACWRMVHANYRHKAMAPNT
jgi:hypothetical protein